jgi:glycosyltransferase involved in cell wall biosynthesis
MGYIVLCSTNDPMVEFSSSRVIRVLAIVEGTKVSGPAKNILEFCRASKNLNVGPAVSTSLAIFVRPDIGRWKPSVTSNQVLDAATATGLEVHPIPERFAFDPRVIWGLRKLVKRLQPDIIQTHHVKSHFLVRLSGLGHLYRWIAFHHGYTSEGVRMRLYDQLDRWSLRAPSQVVTVCEPFKRQLVSLGVPASRIMVLHNSVAADWLNGQEPRDTVASTVAKKISNWTGHERVVLAVGRLSKEKAFTDLIAAMDELRRVRRDLLIKLQIVGDGPERSRIEQAIRDRDLQDRITLAGHVQDVRPYCLRADVLAVSSASEGSPNVVLEAMAAGVPVVATSVGGIPELVTDKRTGLLVPPSEPKAMASAINLLFSDPDLAKALARNALEMVRQWHSPQDRARRLLELYERVHASGHKVLGVAVQ